MLVLAAGCIAGGLAPALCWPAIARVVAAWRPVPGESAIPVPLATLGTAHLVLALLVFAAAAALWHRVRQSGLRRAPTWDCGFAVPSPRMQYTSGGFAGIATRWFSPIVRPEHALRRPRGVFPTRAVHLRSVPDAVLERIVEPVSRAVLHVSSVVRRLQHGRVQFYIVYLMAGLAAVGALVMLEGRP
jgi:hydrogenase-4 component B